MSEKKIAIVVLTRGYTNINEYNTLIQRNKHILKNLAQMTFQANKINWM